MESLKLYLGDTLLGYPYTDAMQLFSHSHSQKTLPVQSVALELDIRFVGATLYIIYSQTSPI